VVDTGGTTSAWAGTEATGATAVDTATVAGVSGFTPSGSVTYKFFDNGACSGTAVHTDSPATLGSDGGVPNSSTTSALGAGSYSDQAVYSGDSNYGLSSGSCEPFSVAKATPTAATVVKDAATGSAWAGTEVAGAKAFDTASVSGVSGFTPGGSVTYSLFGNGSCSGTPSSTEHVMLNGGVVPDSSASSPLGAGSYSYQASYTGDASYQSKDSSCEPFAVIGGPTATITSPSDHQAFSLNQVVATSFACQEASNPAGPGISSCKDSNGASSPGGHLDTSTLGARAYTVTATSQDGLTGTAQIHYTVLGGPSATITTPSDGATYTRLQSVHASYSCQDAANGPGIASCAGSVANGSPIDTAQAGQHTFTVTATSKDGLTHAAQIHYTVALPSNHFTVSHIKVHHDGIVEFDVTVVAGPGELDVLETAWKFNEASAATVQLQPAPHRFVFSREHLAVGHAGTLHVTVAPNQRGKRLLVHHHGGALRIRLWVTYQPTGGNPRSIGFYGRLVP
jgi:hypothetical protein